MKLSAQIFEQVSQNLRCYEDTTPDERRIEPRVGIMAHVVVTMRQPGNPVSQQVELRIRDLSAGGIGLMTRKPILVGSRFSLLLPRSEFEKPLATVYEVKYCRQLSSYMFQSGGKLIAIGNRSANLPAASFPGHVA
ncbi:MAG: PilZ domain-containing protein [Phycisphaerae bacterium]